MPKNTPKTGMGQESSAIEQAIARALRDNLERIQRTSEELHHAVGDVVAACGSNKPTNALPSLLRAQTSAAALAASLEVLSRFVTVSMQTGPRSPLEEQITNLVGRVAHEPAAAPQRPAPTQPVPMASHAKAEALEVEEGSEEVESRARLLSRCPSRRWSLQRRHALPNRSWRENSTSAGFPPRSRNCTGARIAWPKFQCRT